MDILPTAQVAMLSPDLQTADFCTFTHTYPTPPAATSLVCAATGHGNSQHQPAPHTDSPTGAANVIACVPENF